MNYYFGVDPGHTDLAYAIIDRDYKIIKTEVLCPKELGCGGTPYKMEDAVEYMTLGDTISGMSMERYVTYDGKSNPRSEDILMITGQIQFWSVDRFGVTPVMWRAFDWKSRLSKHMYKQGFRNPSDRLDKVFSLAAARFLFPDYEFKTDHEADAACMAYIARMLDR